MSKKLISVMLALVMVLSAFSIAASAVNVQYEDPEAEEAYYQMWFLETANEPDEDGNYLVDVYLEANYTVGAISFHVDADGATLVDADASDFIWDADDYNPDVECVPASGNVYIIPKPTDATTPGLVVEEATHIATLKYKLDAETATITLVNDAKTIDNDGKLIAARLGDDILSSETMYYGQFVNDIDYNEPDIGEVLSEVILGEEVAAADPILEGVDGGYVDTDRMYVYGVPVGADANDYFTVTDGSFDVTGNATGDTLTVYTEGGDVFAEYTLVIFGDVNCDGAVDGSDALAVSKHAYYVAEFTDDVILFAADVNADESVDGSDSLAVSKHAYYVADLLPNVWDA